MERVVQISLPRVRLRVLLPLIAAAACFFCWWILFRPYVRIPGGVLQASTREIYANEAGRMPQAIAEDFFHPGQTLLSMSDPAIPNQLQQAELNIKGYRQAIEQEKAKFDQSMQQYVYLQNEVESQIGPTELTDQLLTEIQQIQDRIMHAEQEISELESSRAAMKEKMEKMTISAPFKGMILQRFKQAGERFEAGEPLFLLCDLQTRAVEAKIPEKMLGSLHIGMPVHILFAAYPGKKWPAQIAWISPMAESGAFKIRFTSENFPLQIGLNADIQIKIL